MLNVVLHCIVSYLIAFHIFKYFVFNYDFAFRCCLVLNCLMSYLCLNNKIVSCFNYLCHVVLYLLFRFFIHRILLVMFLFIFYFFIIYFRILFIMFYFVFYLSFFTSFIRLKTFFLVWNLGPIWTLFAGLCTAQMRPKRVATVRARHDMA